ncbi:universal stress family protein [Aerococcus urinaehominis]|uniref:Universal stress protein n=1 Tax=Aerococcus urinaehominis TaxID=128944 RepID=A0A0X8FLD0_9LACT|nr:universal stress protein [Aerococcus urinaehominis]AMB99357.1 universal stress family protein [Aerococcus urinaehominis]SDM22109.1 Nucleotide-binding universal stress protein, UspA family [Aerococcus urinaehominis]
MVEKYRKILVPVDGSDQAHEALLQAVQIAERNQAELILFTAIDDLARYGNLDSPVRLYEQVEQDSKDMLKTYYDEVKDSQVKIEAVAMKGDPRYSVVDYANEANVDLIVMGSTGKGNIERLMMGSVSEYVVRHAHINVLIVK